MARIYNPTRSMLDSGIFNTMNASMQNRIQNEANRNKLATESIRNMLSGVGKAVDSGIDEWKQKALEKRRYEEIMNQATVAQQADPVFMAAVRDYAKTGSSNPIIQYNTNKEMAEARKREAEKSNRTQNWHDSLEKAAAEEKYERLYKDSLAAQDNGDYAQAEFLKNTAKRLKNDWLVNRGIQIGEDFDNILEARKQAKAKEAEQKAIDERDARMMAASEALEKQEAEEKAANQAENALWVEANVIPTIEQKETYVDEKGKVKSVPTATKKEEVKQQILRLLQDKQISDEQAKHLSSLVDSIETLEEATKKSIKSSTASFAGSQNTKKLEATEEQKKLAKDVKDALGKGYTTFFDDEKEAFKAVYGEAEYNKYFGGK